MAHLRITFSDLDAAKEEAVWLNLREKRTYIVTLEPDGTYFVGQRRYRGEQTVIWDTTMQGKTREPTDENLTFIKPRRNAAYLDGHLRDLKKEWAAT